MSKPIVDQLSLALGAIANHRELIHSTYVSGRYTKNGSKQDREAYVLQQNRIFVPEGRDGYRLSSLLTRFFDEVTQKQKLYEQMGDSGSKITRLSDLSYEYGNAVLDGRVDESDLVAEQFHGACADLADTFSSDITKLINQADTNFAVVKSISAKNRQNTHFLGQAKRLSDALNSLEKAKLDELFNAGTVDFNPLLKSYRVLITGRLDEWHSEIARLLHFFESYLYRLRDIAPDVKRFRHFANFIQQNPGYVPPEIDLSSHHRPAWMMRALPITLAAHSDPLNDSAFDYLSAISRNLPITKVTHPSSTSNRERMVGVIERRADSDKRKFVIRPDPHRIALNRLAKHAAISTQPISALEWKRENSPELSIPDDIWLLFVLSAKDIDKPIFTRLQFDLVEHTGMSAISRNRFVRDVMLHGR